MGGGQLVINLDGGNVSEDQSGIYLPGQNITLIEPTKEGFTFSHWSIESGNGVISGNNITIGTQDTIIKAVYINLTSTLTFNANGGSVTPTTKEVTYNEEYGELPVPTRTDYTFVGWYTESTGGTKIISTTTVNILSNQTLYAHYIKTETEYAYIAPTTAIPTPYYTFPILESGYYKLEVWGAQGGCSLANAVSTCSNVGYGGYSVGTIALSKENVLSIYIGGSGGNGRKGTSPGGYNGGGTGTWDNSDDEGSGGGGGATHIATTTGLLSTLSLYATVNNSPILIVAGGSGGSSWSYAAGSGGGYYGGITSTTNQTYATQNNGYSFGQGQNASGVADSDGVGGGGGGYYGGYMNNVAGKSSGSGGSGYIGNTLLTDKYMYCYNCLESTDESTYTIKTNGTSTLRDTTACPSGYSNSAISKCAKSGDGYAKITYLGP